MNKIWIKAAVIRAVKTMAQVAASMLVIGAFLIQRGLCWFRLPSFLAWHPC